MKKEEMQDYTYYVIEAVDSGERLVGMWTWFREVFLFATGAMPEPFENFIVIREVDLS